MKTLLVHMSTRLVYLLCGVLLFWMCESSTSFAASADSMTDTVTVIALTPSDDRAITNQLSESLIGLTRKQRYDLVRAKLESQAELTRIVLQPTLDSLIATGDIYSYRSHWLINSFTVSLPQSKIGTLEKLHSVAKVIIPPRPELIAPVHSVRSHRSIVKSNGESSVESNLESIRARAVWSQGYTGAGRIICSFDTGVDGFHPALRSSWQGKNGDSAASWFDPIDRKFFPHVINNSSLPEHGSHTMGIMVGRDTLTGDTIGVAPGAKWISAAVIDIPGASIVDAFEWAADPDRDPNTISDVPDVINHSWGAINTVLGCDALFHRLIDNSEALGIVNIFAAGNEGRQGSATVRNPANRALDSIDCFAVGFVNHRTAESPSLWSSSSRGPSDCDGSSIKPNVVAPGVNIRSSIPGGAYGFRTGSSMSAPHVSGIVALLRQKNPDASPEQIKSAILSASTDLGASGPDNDFGWGYVNALFALEAIAEADKPVLRVTALTPNRPDETGLLQARVRIEYIAGDNVSVTGVRGSILSSPPSVTVLSGSVNFGSLAAGVSLSSSDNIIIQIDDSLSAGSVIPLDFVITADGGFRQMEELFVLVGNRVQKQFYTHTSERMSFTVSNFGEYGFSDGSYTPLGFAGLRFEEEERSSLFEMAFIMGLDSDHVSDGIRNIGLEPDRDFSPAPGGAMSVTSLDSIADVMTASSFVDTLAELPLGFTVRQKTFGWSAAPLDNVVVIDYIIVNTTNVSVGGLYAGMFADWDIGALNKNIGSFDLQNEIGYMAYVNADTSMFRGIAVLNSKGMVGHYVQDMSEFGNLRNPFNEEFKYNALSSRFMSATVFEQGDLAHFITTGPYTIAAGDSAHATFAIIAANSFAEMQSTIRAAKVRIDSVIEIDESPQAPKPTTFRLEQNFPNPFNPSTEIAYALEAPGKVTLRIYNVLGQQVRELVNAFQDVNEYTVKWDGADEAGAQVASGMYFYRLNRGAISLSRKMILLK